MLDLVFWIVIFVIALAVLIKSAGWFTDNSEKIGLILGIPSFVVGVTIVSIGTSLPELVSSVLAAIKGSSDFVIGNVVGSNIANIFLILGIGAIISKKLIIDRDLIKVDLPIFMGSAFLLLLTIMDGSFSFIDALIMILGLFLYFLYSIKGHKDKTVIQKIVGEELNTKKDNKGLWKAILIVLVCCVLIFFSANYVVEATLSIANILGIGVGIIAISVVALGTSLPELVVTIIAAKKGKAELAIGNVLGSNIFNIFGVMGVPGLITTLSVSNFIMSTGIVVMLIASILLVFMSQDKEITKWEGYMLILCYFAFLVILYNAL